MFIMLFHNDQSHDNCNKSKIMMMIITMMMMMNCMIIMRMTNASNSHGTSEHGEEKHKTRTNFIAKSSCCGLPVSLAVSVCPLVRMVVLSVSDRCVVQQDSTLDGSRVMALQSRSPPLSPSPSTGSSVPMELQLNVIQFGTENWHIWMVIYIFVYSYLLC